MKLLKSFSLVILLVFAVSCSDDDEDDVVVPTNTCTSDSDLKTNIVGTWDINSCMGGAPVVFEADSSYQDPDDCLISVEGRIATERRYVIVNDTTTFSIFDSAGFIASFSVNPPLENCSERIRFQFFGQPLVFTRQ